MLRLHNFNFVKLKYLGEKAFVISRLGQVLTLWEKNYVLKVLTRTRLKSRFASGSGVGFKSLIKLFMTNATLSGLFIANYSKPAISEASQKYQQIIEEADLLYELLKFDELYNLLAAAKDSKNDEILWRLARATYEKARNVTSSEVKKKLYAEALHYLEEANEVNENNFAIHKWLAIIKDCYYTLEGVKARISHLYDMKSHMEKACALKPLDGTSWYVLGMWYFGIADISWYERKAASIFFATPPQASYDDALKVFLKAEEVEPNFYSKNHLMIGKCLFHLNRKQESKSYFEKVLGLEARTADDLEAKVEADQWLKRL